MINIIDIYIYIYIYIYIIANAHDDVVGDVVRGPDDNNSIGTLSMLVSISIGVIIFIIIISIMYITAINHNGVNTIITRR